MSEPLAWSAWLRQEALRWNFIAKTFVAGMLALYLSFRWQLEAPGTALVTVFIVAQPQSGLIIAKGFYRLLGTTLGSLVTLLMLALFAQNQALFLISLSLWVGLCVACAAWFRDFQAYAFVLAGYTACLIGFPAVQHPEMAFDLTIARVSEIYIGILCTAVVSDLFWPQHITPRLIQTVRQHYYDLIAYLVKAVATPLDISIHRHDPLRFVIQILELESLRASAIFEDPRSRIRSDRLRLFSADFMRLTTTLHALEQLGHRMRTGKQVHALKALRPVVESLGPELTQQGQIPRCAAETTTLLRQLGSYQPWLAQHLHDIRHRLQQRVTSPQELDAFDDAAELMIQMVSELFNLTSTYASLLDNRHQPTRPAPAPAFFTPPQEVILTGVRAVLAMLVLSAFWIATAWPQGSLAATIACIACALFAAAPQPQRAVIHMATGFTLGLIAAMVMNLMVLPNMHSFVYLGMGMLPFIILGLWIASRTRTYGIGIAYCMMLGNALPLHNRMYYDGVLLLNSGLAQLIGLGIAGIAFSVLRRGQLLQQRRYYIRHLAHELAATCRRSLQQLPHSFDGRTRDLMRQVMIHAPHLVQELIPCTLAVLELGDAIVQLRQHASLPGSTTPPHRLKQVLRQLEHSLRHPQLQEQRQLTIDALVDLIRMSATGNHPAIPGSDLRRVLHIFRDDPWLARFNALSNATEPLEGVSFAP